MRSIRNKLPPALLRGLEPLGQALNSLESTASSSCPRSCIFVGVISLPDDADGGKKSAAYV